MMNTTVTELRLRAKDMGIKGYSKMNKEQLSQAIALNAGEKRIIDTMSREELTSIAKAMDANVDDSATTSELRLAVENESENREYKLFKQTIINDIKNYLPYNYADSRVTIQQVNKNNEVLDGLTITSPDSNVCPTIYINSYYDKYLRGAEMENILEDIAEVRTAHEVSTDFNVSDISDFDKAKLRIKPRLFGTENNPILDNRPHRIFAGDLAITYCVELSDDINGKASVPITNQLLDVWKVTEDDLYNIAINNNDDCVVTTMRDVMIEMMLKDMVDDFDGDVDAAKEFVDSMIPDGVPMHVVTNKAKLNGAVTIINYETIKEIQKALGSEEFYILPSSIHECIIIGKDNNQSVEELRQMVREINETQVAPQDRLSNSVYEYKDGKIKLA